MMVIEGIILGATAVVLGSFWLTHKVLTTVPMTPELARAKREAIAKKRAIINERRERYVKAYDKNSKDSNWTGICNADKELKNLADEEGNIPIYDGE